MPTELKTNEIEPEQAEQSQQKASEASSTSNEDPRRSAVRVALSVVAVMVLILGLSTFEEQFARKTLSGTDLKQPEDGGATLRARYSAWTIDQNVRVFEWHARSTKIIFWVSMLITVTGIAFAFWQFVEASRTSQVAEKADRVEIKNQFGSLAFRSRSLATFMMFVSIAYLLIYVTLVYPVKTIEGPKGVIETLDPPSSQTPPPPNKMSEGPTAAQPPR